MPGIVTETIPYRLDFISETTLYQNEVKCKIQENEFNYSQNPTMLMYGNNVPSGTLADNVTGSDFRPYFTTVGLFNAANELLVVGKMATPYPVPPNTDLNIIVRWDS